MGVFELILTRNPFLYYLGYCVFLQLVVFQRLIIVDCKFVVLLRLGIEGLQFLRLFLWGEYFGLFLFLWSFRFLDDLSCLKCLLGT